MLQTATPSPALMTPTAEVPEREAPAGREMELVPTSRLPGFYRLSPEERLWRVSHRFGLSAEDRDALTTGGLDRDHGDALIENVIGIHALPVGLAVNARIGGVERVVPMAVEEPSIVAAVSNMARVTRASGGVAVSSGPSIMIAQIQLLDVPAGGAARIEAAREELLALARELTPRMVERGGGPVGLELREVEVPEEDGAETFLVVHVLVDCLDCMGANVVNTVAEGLAPRLAELSGGRYGLRILSNLTDQRTATATVRVPFRDLDPTGGAAIARGIVDAYRFAAADPYRASTHNKGIMNGIDAVAIATGNDWRAIEAGAHAYACRTGRYRPMSRWWMGPDHLAGELTLPMAVGTVGGTIQAHPTVRANLKLLGVERARDLAEILVAVGLLQNMAALHALATDGIQRGHMSLHCRHVALGAGVSPAALERVVEQMVAEGAYSPADARRIAMLGDDVPGEASR